MLKQLSSLNLNKLVVLYSLLTEKNVTKAAKKLNISTPAVSTSLKQLREIFEDELLVRIAADRLMLTPKGKILISPLEKALGEILDIYNINDDYFHSEDMCINFKIGMLESTSACLSPSLSEKIMNDLPLCTLDINHIHADWNFDRFSSESYDLIVGPMLNVPGDFKNETLFSTKFVVVANRNHPIFKTKTTLEEALGAFPTIKIKTTNTIELNFHKRVPNSLESHAKEIVSVPGCMEAFNIISKSDQLCIIGENVFDNFKDQFHLKKIPCNLPFPEINVSQYWDSKYDISQSVRWLRSAVKTICSEKNNL